MKAFAVICANGLGHFRRTVALLDRIAIRAPSLDLTVACCGWQIDRTAGWAPLERLKTRAEFLTGGMEPGLRWSTDPKVYEDGRLLSWERWLVSQPSLQKADWVLSDNLCGVLEHRPDAVLVGSFLWSDVLSDAFGHFPAVREFVQRERDLLELFRPPMLCVGEMATPGVLSRTNAVKLPFMAEGAAGPEAARSNKVAFLAGASGAADSLFSALRTGLSSSFELADNFGFEPRDYAGLSLIVARPGMGTITSAIAARVPLVLLDEGDNSELEHNGRRVEALGAGVYLGAKPSLDRLERAIREVLASAETYRSRQAQLATDGLDRAADWLLANRVEETNYMNTTKRNGNGVDWLCVPRTAKLSEILRRFEGATERNLPAGIALVTGPDGKLEGTVTDGDIRRAMLRFGTIDVSASEVMHKEPITFPDSASFQSIISRLPLELERRGRRGRKFLGKIVLTHDDGRPARVLDYHQLWEQRVATHRHVVVVGLGYVGLTLALELAEEGFRVTGVDVDADKIAGLNRGESHVHEQGLVELLREQLKTNFRASTKAPDDGDVFVIAVGTPVSSKGGAAPSPDLSVLIEAVDMIGAQIQPGTLVVLRSTVPVGTTREVVAPRLEKLSGLRAGADFHLAFAPERTVEGRALQELRELPQIIGGINQDSVEATVALFRELTPTMVRVESLEAAELAKLINNAYRDLIFAFSNEMARVCSVFNIDAVELIRAANHGYPRDPVPLPSPGVGGPCLTKDPYILGAVASRAGLNIALSHQGRSVNEGMHAFVAGAVLEQLREAGKDPAKARVLVCGLAFKGRPETGDIRNSTSVEIAKLLARKVEKVFGHDPVVPRQEIAAAGLEPVELPSGFGEVDAVLFLNNHRSYEKIDVFRMVRALRSPAIVYDAWRLFRPDDVLHAAQAVYMGLGFVRKSESAQ